MSCLSDILIGMRAESVKGNGSCVDLWNSAQLFYSESQIIYLLQKHSGWNWNLAFGQPSVCVLKIMPGNKGCAACQRGNTGNNLTSKRAAPAVCSRVGELGWRITAAQTKQRESCRPLALLIYQISNLTCSFTESPPPKKKKNRCRVQGPVARYFWFIWSSCRNTRYDPKNGIAWQELCWTAFPFPS